MGRVPLSISRAHRAAVGVTAAPSPGIALMQAPRNDSADAAFDADQAAQTAAWFRSPAGHAAATAALGGQAARDLPNTQGDVEAYNPGTTLGAPPERLDHRSRRMAVEALGLLGLPSLAHGFTALQSGDYRGATANFLAGGLPLLAPKALHGGMRELPAPLRNVERAPADAELPSLGKRLDDLSTVINDSGSPFDSWIGMRGDTMDEGPSRREMLDDLIRRQRTIDGSYPIGNGQTLDFASTESQPSINDLIEAGSNPETASGLPGALGEYLGHFGVGSSAENTPILARSTGPRDMPPWLSWLRRNQPPAEPVTPIPVNPTREIARAADGSVLPVRPAEPFRQSLVGGSEDLRGAAGLGRNDSPYLAALRAQGFDVDTPLYHGSPGPAEGDLRPSRAFAGTWTKPEISLTTDPANIANHYASQARNGGSLDQFDEGAAIYPVFARNAQHIGGPEAEYVVRNSGDVRPAFGPDFSQPGTSTPWPEGIFTQGEPGDRLGNAPRASDLRSRHDPFHSPTQVLSDGGAAHGEQWIDAYRGLQQPYDPTVDAAAARRGDPLWFHSDPQSAGTYATPRGPVDFEASPNILPSKLRLGRVLRLDAKGQSHAYLPVTAADFAVLRPELARMAEESGLSVRQITSTDEVAEAARRLGYDSIEIRNVSDDVGAGGKPGTVYGVFSPENVRSRFESELPNKDQRSLLSRPDPKGRK